MIVKVLKNEKNYLELELNSVTMAEVVRNVLWDDSSVKIAAWKREHPTKNPVLVLKTEGKDAKKVLADSLKNLDKLNTKVMSEVKKIVKK